MGSTESGVCFVFYSSVMVVRKYIEFCTYRRKYWEADQELHRPTAETLSDLFRMKLSSVKWHDTKLDYCQSFDLFFFFFFS